MNNDTDDANLGAFLLGLPLAVIVIGWLIVGIVAAVVAPKDRQGTFLLITLFFLGPLGIAAAAIAQPRVPLDVHVVERPRKEGRIRHMCPRCGAKTDLLDVATGFDCWRCSQHYKLTPPVVPATKPTWFSKDWWRTNLGL